MSERQRLRFRDCLSRKDIATIVALGAANAASLAALVLVIREIARIIERIAAEGMHPVGGVEQLAWGLLLLAVVASIQAGLAILEFSVPEAIGFRAVHQLRLRLYEHMSGMAPRQIQHRSRGSLILRLTGDLTMLRTWLSRGLGHGIIAGVTVLACIAVIAAFSPWIALAITVVFAGGTLLSIRIGRLVQKMTSRVRRKRSLLTSNIDEQVNGLAVVQIFGRTQGETARLERQSESMTDTLIDEARLRGLLRGISGATGWVALGAVIGIGAFEVAAGRIDLGSLFVALLATRLLQGYVRKLGLAHDYWRRAEISRGKLEDFLNSSSRQLADPALDRLTHNRATIVFDSVSVAGALEEFSAVVPAGQHVAIVGASGAGKSTLIQALARMTPIDGGVIHIGDQNLADCQVASVFRKIGMVSRDLPLMRGTIRRNLTYRQPGAAEEEIHTLLRRCNLWPLVDGFTDGLNHWITESGSNLAIGERQRLELARAILGNPPILLLDEATGQLDPENRAVFRDIVGHYAGTIINITHDLADIETADIVWTMESGRLVSAEPARAYVDRQRSRQRGSQRLMAVS